MATLGVAGWRSFYSASASEVLDLLDFTRLRRRSLLKSLLEIGTVTVALPTTLLDLPDRAGPLTLKAMPDGPRPAPLALYAGQTHLVTVAAQDQADLAAILDTGLGILIELDERSDPPSVLISLPFDVPGTSEL
ncbi:hypothetical protein GCM10022419_105390 [Nonomuraea rosea]|uniref:Uncharacterized protein n=1 Tax=Nonomuraea rosea TaxID=638574 RepID=A0ABP6ZAK0_9ACTN